MYDLPYHKEHDERVLADFIASYPFAFLTGCDGQGRPVATQVPLLLEVREGRKVLRGHFMRNTDHHKAFQLNQQALVVFSGSHSYVSGAWYENPHTPSTWNYMSVHVEGSIRFLDNQALEDVLQHTSLHFENGNQESPTVFANLPENFRRQALKALVGFEIEVNKLDSVFKLSQDRDVESYLNIMAELSSQDHDARVIAGEMQKRKNHLFPQSKDEANT